ncbi:MAG: thioredoxin domain-containing protein [Fibrobacter sp.]|nr:thioredoxin domain-containing protein [Fibrobacter sp.]
MSRLTCSIFCLLIVMAFCGHADNQQAVTDSSQLIADKIVKSEIPVLVDFWAQWCAPCKMLNPIIKDVENEFKDQIKVVKVNIDIHKNLALYFGVRQIPEVFILTNKTVVRKLTGVQPKEVYVKTLKDVIDSVANITSKKADNNE